MKIQSSFETLYALIFAACVLLALFLLTACDRAAGLADAAWPVAHDEAVAPAVGAVLAPPAPGKSAPAGS